ncbi:ABC transporter ATP-binding protein [Rhizobium sp. P40RR-XXII]|uniref:ABC transporter ATP-binding protein n=1 Tax=Rhizobium sp. P40RR-XXII TaxID=2726739 RepID=UPI001456ABCC|nr:ABC transporter ATP-binding protein [Rhizobium sp. P40RR-XXII]NLS19086.1 ABC transporter ATP-binding protein [Rhizobium sp. P40RR-XXII]
MSAPVIEAAGLTKRYGRLVAVEGLDLVVNKGEIFGLLGPNGSGKTTTILLLLGLTEPDGGSVRVLGHDPLREPLEVKRRVGYLPDAVGFYDSMSAWENLRYTMRLAGIADAKERIASALARVRLTEVADRRVSTFSRGMRQRLGIADLLAKGSELAILDEPTSGLDPQSTQELLDLIVQLAGEGMTIVLSSHLLSMVQAICSRVALFHRGRIGLVGRVTDLASQVLGGSYIIEVEADGCDAAKILAEIPQITRVTAIASDVTRVDAKIDIRAEIASRIVAADGRLKRLSMDRSSLDEVYVRYFEQVDHAA